MKYLLSAISIIIIILLGQAHEIEISKAERHQPYLAQWQGEFQPVKGQLLAIITAYSARPEETDDSPDIVASNKKAEVGMIANNCLEFGTPVEIQNKTYYVEDRMNRRMGCDKFDILMADYETALNFGVKRTEVLIY